ncbi:MAG: hypothetical protein ACLSG7_00995 [Clostridia bacterium]|nr:unknown [Clostridium sp. CAG:389]
MENNQQENIIKSIYKGRYEELDKIISKKIKENSNKIKDEEEKNNIKNSIIMEEMYKQGFKDGVNLIIQCQE